MAGTAEVKSTAAIPTLFDGIEYRSRLEAKWAAFFRKIEWEFTYEPFDGHGYIPDFVIHGERPFVVEVKPAVTWAHYEEPLPKITKGLQGVWDGDLLVVGVSPFPGFDTLGSGHPVAGLLGELASDPTLMCMRTGGPTELLLCPDLVGDINDMDPFASNLSCPHSEPLEDAWHFSRAPWAVCEDCGQVTITHEEMSFTKRPCGYYPGGNWGEPVGTFALSRHWAEATNEVKWRGQPR